MASKLRIGIIGEADAAAGIAQALAELSFSLGPVLQLDQLERIGASDAQAWILALDDEAVGLLELLQALELAGKPVLHGLDLAPAPDALAYRPWLKRLGDKLEALFSARVDVSAARDAKQVPELASHATYDGRAIIGDSTEVWVLAASLGGPEAVKTFVDCLPRDLDIVLLYAQHIDAHFAQVLVQVLGRHAQLDYRQLQNGQPLVLNEVQMVPVDRHVHFQGAYCKLSEQPWSGPYGPNINALLQTAQQAFGKRCNVIVFSGMAGDAVAGTLSVQQAGGQVWVQTPASCVQPAMPESVLAALKPEQLASPEQLAQALVARVRESKT